MVMVQSGNDPSCKHDQLTPWEKTSFMFIPMYAANCVRCGECIFKFPDKSEVPPKEMENAFEQSERAARGEPTD